MRKMSDQGKLLPRVGRLTLMGGRGLWLRCLAAGAATVLTVTGSGCLSFMHPVHSPPHDCLEPCLAIPHCCKDHVYVFLINGLDPFECGNLRGVQDYLHSLGFNRTYYAQLYHGLFIKSEVRRLHEEDPEAHFVIVGFSFGA